MLQIRFIKLIIFTRSKLDISLAISFSILIRMRLCLYSRLPGTTKTSIAFQFDNRFGVEFKFLNIEKYVGRNRDTERGKADTIGAAIGRRPSVKLRQRVFGICLMGQNWQKHRPSQSATMVKKKKKYKYRVVNYLKIRRHFVITNGNSMLGIARLTISE